MDWILISAFLGYAAGVISCILFRLRLGSRGFFAGFIISVLSLVSVVGWMVPQDWLAIPIVLWFVGLFLQGVALGARLMRPAASDTRV